MVNTSLTRHRLPGLTIGSVPVRKATMLSFQPLVCQSEHSFPFPHPVALSLPPQFLSRISEYRQPCGQTVELKVEMAPRAYLRATTDGDTITNLMPRHGTEYFGKPIPAGYKGTALKLWIFCQAPNYEKVG